MTDRHVAVPNPPCENCGHTYGGHGYLPPHRCLSGATFVEVQAWCACEAFVAPPPPPPEDPHLRHRKIRSTMALHGTCPECARKRLDRQIARNSELTHVGRNARRLWGILFKEEVLA